MSRNRPVLHPPAELGGWHFRASPSVFQHELPPQQCLADQSCCTPALPLLIRVSVVLLSWFYLFSLQQLAPHSMDGQCGDVGAANR